MKNMIFHYSLKKEIKCTFLSKAIEHINHFKFNPLLIWTSNSFAIWHSQASYYRDVIGMGAVGFI